MSSDCIDIEKQWSQKRESNNSSIVEEIRFRCAGGTRILVAHDIEPGFVIPELVPSLEIKSSSPGIDMKVRVVLPETPAPNGQGPMTTYLSGPSYSNTGRWQALSFKNESLNLKEKLQRQVWVLRNQFGSHVSIKDAYVDQIVLNLYTFPGNHSIQIKKEKVIGVASARNIVRNLSGSAERQPIRRDFEVQTTGFNKSAAPQSQQESQPKKPSLVKRDGTVLEVKKTPYFPRIIQHNGEDFAKLKALGFNTIELKATATTQQLQRAQQLNLWLVCPPPPSVGLEDIPFYYDRVLAWSVGQNLTGRDLNNVQQHIREIRHSDLRDGRPIVADVKSHWTIFGNEADVLSIGLEPLGTSFFASQYSDWIRQRVDAMANSKPTWVKIQTEFSADLLKQVASIASNVPPTPIEPQQLKFLAFEALAGGARGLRFVSRNRLDADDPVTRLRALSLKWINTQVSQLEPWAVGGALMGELKLDNDALEVTAINTSRSRLLLIQRPTHHEQYWAGDRPLEDVQFADTASTFTDRGYWLTDHGLTPLPTMRNLGGAEIRLDQCPYATAVVLTQDPMVLDRINQGFQAADGQTIVQMHSELTRQWLAIMQLIDSQMSRMGRGSAAASGSLNEAINSFRKANELINTNSPMISVGYLHQADERLAFARREMVTQPLGMFQSKTSTPFLAHSSLVPIHWQLASRLGKNQWQPNALAGGDFENLEHMVNSGWQNQRMVEDDLITNVDLVTNAANGGQFGLKLSVATDRPPKLIQTTPVWVTTPKIPVRSGQMVRIHGWVNIPSTIQGSYDGLMITESLGGPALAERITSTEGWQEFTLYRGVPKDGSFDITFALTGLGEAMVDEVTVRTIDLPNE